MDKGQVSLLYLPVVIACAIRYGFGPAVLGAVLSFLCWDFFFIPPTGVLTVADRRDWLSLIIFLVAALTTSRLASRARFEAQAALDRERETTTLYQASQAISGEVDASRILPTLAEQVLHACQASRCVVFRQTGASPHNLQIVAAASIGPLLSGEIERQITRVAYIASENNSDMGFKGTQHLWLRGLEEAGALPDSTGKTLGVYIPLRAPGKPVGVLHVGPRIDDRAFSPSDERFMLTLANNAAIVIARQAYVDEAAQAAALREADSLKDSLLSLVSHELRTPLATIKAVASGLRHEDATWSDAQRAEAMIAIDNEADRLSGLVDNLLDLSRLEAGAWQPKRDSCDLAEIVGTALDRLSAQDSARVTVTTQIDLPLVMADYVQIELVITNLLQNALKYSPPGTRIDVSLGSATLDRAGERRGVRLTVRDYGEGIIPEEQDELFDRFYRGQRHRSSTVHGTGLGLALCLAVVRAHGGEIWASNAPVGEHSGAVFSFFLPTE